MTSVNNNGEKDNGAADLLAFLSEETDANPVSSSTTAHATNSTHWRSGNNNVRKRRRKNDWNNQKKRNMPPMKCYGILPDEKEIEMRLENLRSGRSESSTTRNDAYRPSSALFEKSLPSPPPSAEPLSSITKYDPQEQELKPNYDEPVQQISSEQQQELMTSSAKQRISPLRPRRRGLKLLNQRALRSVVRSTVLHNNEQLRRQKKNAMIAMASIPDSPPSSKHHHQRTRFDQAWRKPADREKNKRRRRVVDNDDGSQKEETNDKKNNDEQVNSTTSLQSVNSTQQQSTGEKNSLVNTETDREFWRRRKRERREQQAKSRELTIMQSSKDLVALLKATNR
eukprot:g104.t1